MAFFNSKLVGSPQPPVFGHRPFIINRPVQLIQVMKTKEKESLALRNFSVSRRDAMLFLTAEGLGWSAVFSTKPAKARVGRLEGKKRVMEKLQKLKEEAKMSRPKTEDERTKVPFTQQPSTQNNLTTFTPLIPFLNPQDGVSGPLVEAIIRE